MNIWNRAMARRTVPRGMAVTFAALVATLAAVRAAEAVVIPLEVYTDPKTLRQGHRADNATLVTFELHTESTCNSLVAAETVELRDILVFDRVKAFQLRRITNGSPRQQLSILRHVVDAPISSGDLFVRVYGSAIDTAALGDCQPQKPLGDGGSGSVGPEGPEGPQGPQGPVGPEGPQGAAGADGVAGPEGPAGPQGPAGSDGADGSDGSVGPAGPQGPAGPAGAEGSVGPAGPVGPEGPAGSDGSAGPAGPQGPAGAVGPAGPEGPAGADGSAGPTGPQGPAGAVGPAGPEGPAGADGSAGPAGPQGPAGSVGPAGPEGPAGADGSVGPAGPAGADGSAGPAGPQGPAGPAGADGADGAVGPQGPAGPEGPAGPTSLNAFAFVSRTNSLTINHPNFEVLDFEQEDFDSAGFWDPGQPSRLTVPEDGVYMFHCSAAWAFDATGHREVGIRYGGSGGITTETTQAVTTASVPTKLAITDTFAWGAGTYAECLVRDSAMSPTTTILPLNINTFFYVVRIQ